VGDTSWAFLLVGSFAAVGAAMALGTLAALLRYHRTGIFPGAEEAAGDAAGVSTRKYVALWVRVAIGVVLTIAGFIALNRAGLL
jgi:hypothetical protein